MILDHIAVPGKVGAMENWGLVTYSEGLLMYNSSINYLSSGREVGSVIGHELAHFVSIYDPYIYILVQFVKKPKIL